MGVLGDVVRRMHAQGMPVPAIAAEIDRIEAGEAQARLTEAEMHQEFEDWWLIWPRKEGKTTARNEFYRARRSGVTAEAITAGTRRYAAGRKVDRYFLMASTFLHQRRWEDERPTITLTGMAAAKENLRQRMIEDAPEPRRIGQGSRDPDDAGPLFAGH